LAAFDLTTEVPKLLSTLAARTLAARFGCDLASADWRQYGRLAGFTNRKDKYRRIDGTHPYVRLHEATGGSIHERSHFSRKSRRYMKRSNRSLGTVITVSKRGPIETQEYRGLLRRSREASLFRRPHAGSLAYAIYALSHGVAENEARIALASRDLAHKGSQERHQQYIDRTIENLALRSTGSGGSPNREVICRSEREIVGAIGLACTTVEQTTKIGLNGAQTGCVLPQRSSGKS
jgi:hypothetical protein